MNQTEKFVAEAISDKYHIEIEEAKQIVINSFFPDLLNNMPVRVRHYTAEYWADEIMKDRDPNCPVKRLIVVGGVYRHFKGGKAHVLNLAKHSETGECLVIYECLDAQHTGFNDGIYARPIDMFLSEVDKNKYPDARQKYRFEYIKPDISEE